MNAYRDFWDVPADEAPGKTGAASVMDCSDIQDVLDHLHVRLAGLSVLDVGCGTGRVADLCDPGCYRGYDISPGMVAYARQHGRDVSLIDGTRDLQDPADIVLCLSVLTHLPAGERNGYLREFSALAQELVVDILPGPEGGSFAAWYADPGRFETDLHHHGYTIAGTYSRVSPDGALHRYYHCFRAHA